MMNNKQLSLFVILATLYGCGGSGGSDTGGSGSGGGTVGGSWTSGVFESASTFAAQCALPRSGTDTNGNPFPDRQGSFIDENNWLRSWSNDLYLWYDEIIDQDPSLFNTPDYFELLVTNQTTPSGNLKDRFHFTFPTDEWIALSQSGVSAGYGAEFAVLAALPPRQVVVAFTQPDSPASYVPLSRGAEILRVDGVDVVNGNSQSDVDTINAALFPSQAGEQHTFVVRDAGSSVQRAFAMTAQTITSDPVQNVTTLNTNNGLVGYMHFTDHIATAEQDLVDAIAQLNSANISDLILDLRYNGGGFLSIASELAYMIAGPGPTTGETFEVLQFNDKYPTVNPVTGATITPFPFHPETQGFSLPAGQPLPTLNLPRVFVLTGPNTCSASETIINSLRGVDVEVIQIGATTCGKPFGFYAFDNCGTTYFSIQFQGINAKGFGDYPDGFTPDNTIRNEGVRIPGCSVADDFTRDLGDPLERKLAAALNYRETLNCPAPSGAQAFEPDKSEQRDLSNVNGLVKKSIWQNNRIVERQ